MPKSDNGLNKFRLQRVVRRLLYATGISPRTGQSEWLKVNHMQNF